MNEINRLREEAARLDHEANIELDTIFGRIIEQTGVRITAPAEEDETLNGDG